MNRSTAGSIVAVVATLLTVFLVTKPWAEDDTTTATTRPTGIPAGGRLDAGGSELSKLLQAGRQATWHARYRVTTDEDPEADHTLEVWRKGGRSRQDVEISGGGDAVRTAGIQDGDREVSCRKEGPGPWKCEAVGSPALDPDGTFAAAIGELGNRSVTPRDDTVAGLKGRCFAVTGVRPDVEVCVTDEGVPLRIAGEGARIEITSLDDEVPDSVFSPPG